MTTADIPGIDMEALRRLRVEEDARFAARSTRSAALRSRARRSQPLGVPMSWMATLTAHPPLFVARGAGAWFEDVDSNRYLDMNLVDLAGTLGFANPVVSGAVARCAERGTCFLLPTEEGVVATELLAARTGVAMWQFTGSASGANTELLRIARAATGREIVLMFGGKYHGHIDDTLVAEDGGDVRPEGIGLAPGITERARIIPFNDLDALQRALAPRDVACVLAEPALTNCNLVLADEGFWAAARRLTRDAGTLLYMDEAHTYSFAYGGLTRKWGLDPDGQVMGKGLGSGIPFAVYGVSAELGEFLESRADRDGMPEWGIPLGGTTYANAMALAVARAVLEEALSEAGHAQNARLGVRLRGGLQSLFDDRGLDWTATGIGGRSGWIVRPACPRNADEASDSLNPLFVDTRRVFMANRGVWEAISSAGPAVSFMHNAADVDHYLAVAGEFLARITR